MHNRHTAIQPGPQQRRESPLRTPEALSPQFADHEARYDRPESERRRPPALPTPALSCLHPAGGIAPYRQRSPAVLRQDTGRRILGGQIVQIRHGTLPMIRVTHMKHDLERMFCRTWLFFLLILRVRE